jgi:hypothetical protein
MEQVPRNLIDDFTGFLRGKRFLIHDRDPLFTREFCERRQTAGVTSVRLPPRSPNLNAHAERFVLSIKSECLERMMIVGERHLRRAIAECLEHYHLERNHQGLENRIITSDPSDSGGANGPVCCRPRLGGMLNFYHRRAASMFGRIMKRDALELWGCSGFLPGRVTGLLCSPRRKP